MRRFVGEKGDPVEMDRSILDTLEQLFHQAKRFFQRKGLNEQDAEDCAAEVRLHLLHRMQQGAPLSKSYFFAVLRGCYADFVAAHTEKVAFISLDNVKNISGGVKKTSYCSLSKYAARWNNLAKPTVNCFCSIMKRGTHLRS
ncbi:MAG: hypothetical protein KatS3mg016_2050 [Fimbriimonadales bacterium]|nr:MAG: hypothetical protein KatS3mg016_2050 [Fimbriimonadales bacterium]